MPVHRQSKRRALSAREKRRKKWRRDLKKLTNEKFNVMPLIKVLSTSGQPTLSLKDFLDLAYFQLQHKQPPTLKFLRMHLRYLSTPPS